jgi:hypothetical protein
MKRYLLAVALIFLVTGAASAAPIFTPDPAFPGTFGSVFTPNDGSSAMFDVQAIDMGAVSDPATGTDLGGLWLFSGGAFPSDTLLMFSEDLSEQSSLLFDFSTSVFNAARSVWTVRALSTPAGPVSDPALAALSGIVFAQFTNPTVLTLPVGRLETFRLASLSTQGTAPIPEPATMGLVGIGLAVLGYGVRRRKTRPSTDI